MEDPRPWKVGDLVRIKDTGETALIVDVADSIAHSIRWIKIHTGERIAPWKLNLVSKGTNKVEEGRVR